MNSIKKGRREASEEKECSVRIVDRSSVFAYGLQQLFEKKLRGAGTVSILFPEEVATEPEILKDAAFPRTIAFLDVGFDETFGGIEWIEKIQRAAPECELVLMLTQLDPFVLSAIVQSGVGILLSREDSVAVFKHAFGAALLGSRYISQTVAQRIEVTVARAKWLSQARVSKREFDVLIRLGNGSTIKEIAHELGLSPKTVSTYRTRVMNKVGLRNNAEICFFCLENFPDLVRSFVSSRGGAGGLGGEEDDAKFEIRFEALKDFAESESGQSRRGPSSRK